MIKMFRMILKQAEAAIKDFEKIFFPKKPISSVTTDQHAYLKKYDLEVIKGIGPKTKSKLENLGIKTAYDLIKCRSIQGVSENKISAWKQHAMALQ